MTACSGSADDSGKEITLRVSATSGLTSLIPGSKTDGSSAAALDLIYEYPSRHLDVSGSRGTGSSGG